MVGGGVENSGHKEGMCCETYHQPYFFKCGGGGGSWGERTGTPIAFSS